MEQQIQELAVLAKEVAQNSYSPYSNFPVGAAFEDEAGNVFTGCNVENLSFPEGLCAERTAIVKAVSEKGPSMRVKTLVVYTPTQKATTPCGGCRQVISEFAADDARIICTCDTDDVLDISFKDLFPYSLVIDGLAKK